MHAWTTLATTMHTKLNIWAWLNNSSANQKNQINWHDKTTEYITTDKLGHYIHVVGQFHANGFSSWASSSRGQSQRMGEIRGHVFSGKVNGPYIAAPISKWKYRSSHSSSWDPQCDIMFFDGIHNHPTYIQTNNVQGKGHELCLLLHQSMHCRSVSRMVATHSWSQ